MEARSKGVSTARAGTITHDLKFHCLLVDFYRAKPLLGQNSAEVKATHLARSTAALTKSTPIVLM